MLQHERFEQILPRVYRERGVSLMPAQWVAAARAALPAHARASHQTRFVELGLVEGSLFPLHFTVQGDLHLDVDRVMLHRTVVMPPADEEGLFVEAAVLGHASIARPLDVVACMDWLVRHGHLDLRRLLRLTVVDPWRPGVVATRSCVGLVDARSASPQESRTRVLLRSAGLPPGEPNLDVEVDGQFLGRGDLVHEDLRLVVEYEGRQHAEDPRQFQHDIERYARFRRHGWEYVQVTAGMLAAPRTLVTHVHDAMCRRGYAGPAPSFGPAWDSVLARPLRWTHQRSSVDPQPHSGVWG